MKRILLTGFSGFVSRHFLDHLEREQVGATVLGISRSAPDFAFDNFKHLRCSFRHLDLLDKNGVDDVIYGFRPTHILHLASYSSVGFSWRKPVESFANNTNVFLNLLEQVRTLNLRCRVLSVGSSEEYGTVLPGDLPLHEDVRLRPVSPYGVARVAQEMLSQVFVDGYGLDVVMTRSFNHIGPHQPDLFVVPSLAKQFALIKAGGAPPRLVTGDRTVIRDFVDVRDVVRAYHSLLESGERGQVYNICSGTGTSINAVIEIMQDLIGTRVELEEDPALVRPNENRVVVGSYAKLQDRTGWVPRFSLRESLATILDWWGTR